MVYLTFHVALIFIILMMAAFRRSILSFLYVIVLMPRMKDGAEVLNQREMNQDKQREEVKKELDALRALLRDVEDNKDSYQGKRY